MIERVLLRFAPREGASRAEVRAVAARNLLLGVLLAIFGVALVLSLDRLARGALLDPTAAKPSKLRFVAGLPVLLGFLAMVVSACRLVTGIHPSHDRHTPGARVLRLSLAATIAASLLALVVVVAMAIAR